MTETFESLELAPWIVRQTAKLGNALTARHITLQMNVLEFIFPIFHSLRFETSNAHPSELHSKDSIRFRLHWSCKNWVCELIMLTFQ